MFNVATLRHLASQLPRADFQARVGPFVLVRRPAPALVARRTAEVAATTLPSQRSGTDPIGIFLEYMVGFDDAEVLPAPIERRRWKVGRAQECEFWVDDASVSKHHAVIEFDPEQAQFVLRDLQSLNGTRCDAMEVKDVPVGLPNAAVLFFGDVDFWFLRSAALFERVAA